MRRLLHAALALALTCAALAPAAWAQSSYRVQPGDLLDVTVLEDDALNRQVLVGPDGRISLPLAGTVAAGGQTLEAVENTIADQLASNFAARPSVFVALAALAPPPEAAEVLPGDLMSVYVMGQVLNPGAFEVEPGLNVLQAISLAGGMDRFAATKRVQIRRTDPRTGQERLFLFNFRDVERGGSIQNTLFMQDGDVIIVPERRLFE
jgi:polysaccharide export outer membrane protein